jgi:diguanylate cyclase (GGDEF)-like protein
MFSFHRNAQRPKRRSLLLRFALVSGLLTGLFGTVLALWLASDIRSSNIGATERNATYSLALALEYTHVPGQLSKTLPPAQAVATTKFLKAMVTTGKYVGATAFLVNDTIGYAIEPGRIGTKERTRPQLDDAWRGHLVSKVVRSPIAGVPDLTERTAMKRYGPLLETFVPVMFDGKMAATVILYQQWRPVEKQIDQATITMLIIVGAGSVFLWLGLMGFIVSVARQLKARDKANWRLASHDPLTGLPNRKLLAERVNRALAGAAQTGGSVGLMLIDIDGFKEVNDTLGHHAGDALLEQVGPRLSGALRESDSVARLGGDEFVVLLPELADAEEAMATAQRVSASFAEPFHIEDVELDVTVSIGVAVGPHQGEDFAALLRHADVAMYAAKHAGAGLAAYSPEAERDLTNSRQAQQALARRIRPRATVDSPSGR